MRVNVGSEITNGIYLLGSESANGKTFFLNSINELSTIERRLISGTSYNAYANIAKIIETNLSLHPWICIIDRFDLYINQEICDILNKHASDSIILLDLKDERNLYGLDITCHLDLVFNHERFDISVW